MKKQFAKIGKIKTLPKTTEYKSDKGEPSGEETQNPYLIPIIIAVLILAVIAGGIFAYRSGVFGRISLTGDGQPGANPGAKGAVVAYVNGEPIGLAELNTKYDRLPAAYKTAITKEALLSQLIDERLLLQKAQIQGITASDGEVAAMIDSLIQQSGLSETDLKARLAQQNISYDELLDFYRKEIIITKLINETVLMKVQVSLEQMQSFYDNNTEQFTVPETLNVSHILICHNESMVCTSNRTKEEALGLVSLIQVKINGTNFGELAAQYSEDPSAEENMGNLGMITSEDPYDPTFLAAAFKLNASEVSPVVETDFGYHLIKVFERKPARIVGFDEIKDQINASLKVDEQQKEFFNYLESVRSSAVIVNNVNSTNLVP